MNKKRVRICVGREGGNISTIETGPLSVSDIRNMAKKFDVEVRGVTSTGRSYCVLVPRAVPQKEPDSYAMSGNGDPPKNKINIF